MSPLTEIIPTGLTLGAMTKIYNHVATDRGVAPPVTKFADKVIALRRTSKILSDAGLMVRLVEDDRVWTLVPVEQPETVASAPTKEKKVTKTKTKPASSAPRGDDRVITVIATQNPKRPGTQAAATFAHYASGMTVGAFQAVVGNRKLATLSLAYDQEHGYISIK